MLNSTSQKHMRGATWLEILGGFVVLFVLLMILFPFEKDSPADREKARQTSCMSNEKQLGLAFEQYVEDYDGKFPCGTHPPPLQAVPVGWAGQIYPYIKSTGMFKCPDDRTQPDSKNSYQVPISYAYNWNVGNTSAFAKGKTVLEISPASTKQMNNPPSTVLLCEAFGTTTDLTDLHGAEASSPTVLGGNFTTTSSIDGNGTGLRYATGVLRSDPHWAASVGNDTGDAMSKAGIHTGGSNFLLADGHAKWMKPDQVSAGGSNTISSKDCTAGQGLNPIGKAGLGIAAGTGCSDPSLNATFSIY